MATLSARAGRSAWLTLATVMLLSANADAGSRPSPQDETTNRASRRAPEQRPLLARGTVRDLSLPATLEAAGVPSPIADDLARDLAQAIDLQRDLRPGARFAVLFEPGPAPRPLHAAIELHDRSVLSLWRHQGGWFDHAGRSLRRAYLRTPLDAASVTSGFGIRRHPILGFGRQHQGIDFAAPRGTPVLAAADAVVEETGRLGGYGITVRLRHPDGVETRYAHLSAIAPGLRPGDAVRQGEPIGRVGSTGLSTGPHLHYEVRIGGRAADPAVTADLPAPRLRGEALAAFQEVRAILQASIAAATPMQEVAAAD